VYRANTCSHSAPQAIYGNLAAVTQTAKRVAIATLVAGGIVVAALALWKLRLVVALLFAAMIIAAAIRPGIDWLARRRVPRPLGLALHYGALLAALGVALAFAVPAAIHQIDHALSPSGKAEVARAAQHSSGLKHQLLTELKKRLDHVPKRSELVKPATEIGRKAFEVLIGIFFTLASAAYWIFERDRAVDVVCKLLPRPKRKKVRDTWTLVDLRLGAFVRGQALLIVAVGVVLSLLFWAIGEPYWILVGSFAGLVEIIPVIGPLTAGVVAVIVGFTASVHVALLAAICVLAVRLAEDYLVMPKVLGEAVGLSPLLVLVSVTAVGILFSGWAVLLAVPIAAVTVTLFDVVLRDVDPAEEEVPAVIFSPREAEGAETR
jgi:predicted PurR-regulated permease PerM